MRKDKKSKPKIKINPKKIIISESPSSPVKVNKTNVKSDQTPIKGDQTPIKGDQTPIKGDQTPIKGDKTPMEGDQTPIKSDQTPIKGDQTLRKIQAKTTKSSQLSIQDLKTPLGNDKTTCANTLSNLFMTHSAPITATTKHMTVVNDPARILIGLLKLLLSVNIDSKTLINYMETWKINPNTYLPDLNGEVQMPLIYYCCSNPTLGEFFQYLIDKKIDLNAQMVCVDPTQQIELLYYSQINYIHALISNGCYLNPQKLPQMVEKLLIKGNIKKLITLYKQGAITKEQLIPVLNKNGLVFRILDQLYEKVYDLSQHVNNKEKFEEIYNELLKNYINTFKIFFKNGISINQIEDGESFVQKVLNTYFVPLIRFVFSYQPDLNAEELLHYSNFGLINRQVMQFIYNDSNYHLINESIKDQIVPKKINVKKNLVKKVVQMT